MNTRQRVMELHEQGESNVRIAALLNISTARVSQINGKTRGTSASPARRRLLEIYRYIERRNAEADSPTFEEIAARFKTEDGQPRSNSVVNYWIAEMDKLGLLLPRASRRARSLRVAPLDASNPEIAALLAEEGK